MTSRDFAYWLQGFFELSNAETLNTEQTALIKAHLNMVFIHEIDPSFPAAQQNDLNKAHSRDRVSPGNRRPPGGLEVMC